MTAPTVTPADIKARFPEFASIDDTRIQVFIDDAVLEIGYGRWGDSYVKGVSYLTAHFLTIAEQTTTGGAGGTLAPVASQAVGDVNVAYGLVSTDDATENYWYSTPYGQEYMRLAKIVGLGAVAVC